MHKRMGMSVPLLLQAGLRISALTSAGYTHCHCQHLLKRRESFIMTSEATSLTPFLPVQGSHERCYRVHLSVRVSPHSGRYLPASAQNPCLVPRLVHCSIPARLSCVLIQSLGYRSSVIVPLVRPWPLCCLQIERLRYPGSVHARRVNTAKSSSRP